MPDVSDGFDVRTAAPSLAAVTNGHVRDPAAFILLTAASSTALTSS